MTNIKANGMIRGFVLLCGFMICKGRGSWIFFRIFGFMALCAVLDNRGDLESNSREEETE